VMAGPKSSCWSSARIRWLRRARWSCVTGGSGLTTSDLQHRAGQPYPVRLPLIPGTEAAGTVVAVGADADPGLAGVPVVHFGHLGGVYARMTAVPAGF